MDKFQNKFRIPAARAQWWDYQGAGSYFITICTLNRVHYFGEIENRVMKLSDIGKIAGSEWEKTFDMRPDMNLIMGPFVVMPDHFHAIITIGKNQYNAQPFTNTHQPNTNKFGPQIKNLASIVRGYKTGVTKNARLFNARFQWQSRFHDHIIRDNSEYKRIANYIKSNPKNWKTDVFYKSENEPSVVNLKKRC